MVAARQEIVRGSHAGLDHVINIAVQVYSDIPAKLFSVLGCLKVLALRAAELRLAYYSSSTRLGRIRGDEKGVNREKRVLEE